MRPARTERRALILAILGLLALPGLLLAPSLVGEQAFVGLPTAALSPWRDVLDTLARQAVVEAALPMTADKTLSCWPLLSVSLERLARGDVPLWNPSNLLGVPLLAQATQGALHPLNWTALLLPLGLAFAWTAWMQSALAGVFAFLLARALGLSPLSAWLAGVTYMLCGYLAARWHWYPITGAALYLPLALLAVERLFHGGRGGWTAALAAAVGGAILSGFLQGAVHLLYAAAIWAAARLWTAWRASGATRTAGLRAAGRAAFGVVLGLCLGLPQLLPTLEYVASGESARNSATPAAIREHLAMHPAALLSLLAPTAFGTPTQLAAHPVEPLVARGALRAAWCKPHDNVVETAGWIGIVPLLLALAGLGSRGSGRRLAAGMAACGLLLPLDTFLIEGTTRLPGLSQGDPRRLLVLFGLGGALLAGFGLRRVRESGPPLRLPWVAALLAAGAGCAAWWTQGAHTDFPRLLAEPLARAFDARPGDVLAFADGLQYDRLLLRDALLRLLVLAALTAAALFVARRRRARAAVAATLVALAVLDLGTLAGAHAVTARDDELFAAPPDIERLTARLAGGRLVRVHGDGADGLTDIPLPPNTGLPFGVTDLCGYFALAPRRFVEVLESVEPGSTADLGLAALRDPSRLTSPVLDWLAVSHALSSAPLDVPGWRDAGRIGAAFLVEREAAVPRAWFAAPVPVADGAAALALLHAGATRDHAPIEPLPDGTSPADLPGHAAMPARDTPAASSSAPAADGPRGAPSHGDVRVSITRDDPEAVDLEVDAPRPGVVILADAWLPGWAANLDGRPATLWPAYHTLRAVSVPEGTHRIAMRYRSRVWTPALVAALAALVVVGTLLVRAARRARTR